MEPVEITTILNSGCASLYNAFALQTVVVLTRLTLLLFFGRNIQANHLTEAVQYQKNYRDYSYKFVLLLTEQINSLHYEFMFLRTGGYFMPTRH
jgi:outer membrane lipoprotein-sorting protein